VHMFINLFAVVRLISTAKSCNESRVPYKQLQHQSFLKRLCLPVSSYDEILLGSAARRSCSKMSCACNDSKASLLIVDTDRFTIGFF
jgi:hypothetical protein